MYRADSDAEIPYSKIEDSEQGNDVRKGGAEHCHSFRLRQYRAY